jgi:hypothetical protein
MLGVARSSSIRSSPARIVGDVIPQARRDERILSHFVDERPLRCAPLQARDAHLSINAFQQMTRRLNGRFPIRLQRSLAICSAHRSLPPRAALQSASH